MPRIGIAVRVLLAIALFGLPAGVQAQGDDGGLVAEWHFDEGTRSVLGNIKVSSSHYFTADSKPEAREIVVPGFGLMVAIIGLLAAYLRRI